MKAVYAREEGLTEGAFRKAKDRLRGLMKSECLIIEQIADVTRFFVKDIANL